MKYTGRTLLEHYHMYQYLHSLPRDHPRMGTVYQDFVDTLTQWSACRDMCVYMPQDHPRMVRVYIPGLHGYSDTGVSVLSRIFSLGGKLVGRLATLV